MSNVLAVRQQGSALFICLMILLILSLIGISALRMTIGQSLIAMNSHAEKIAFQSAESGITQLIQEAEQDLTREWLPLDPGARAERCISASADRSQIMSGSCAGVASDSRGVTNTQVTVAKVDSDDVEVAQRALQAIARMQGMPGVVVETFIFTAAAEVPAVNVNAENVQETLYAHF